MRLIGLAFSAALALPLVGPVLADPAMSAMPAAPLTVTPLNPDMMARRMARRAARVDQDIQTLRAGLQLTPAQDALWPPVADAIHAVDTARGFRFRQTMAAAPSQIDGLKLQGDHMAAMGAAIGRLADATKPLVATLTADQKSRLPGLLQGVRLPKVMSRALDLPQDTNGSSWGMGQEGQGQPRQGQPEQQGQSGAGQDRSWGIGPQGQGPAGAPARADDKGMNGAAATSPKGADGATDGTDED